MMLNNIFIISGRKLLYPSHNYNEVNQANKQTSAHTHTTFNPHSPTQASHNKRVEFHLLKLLQRRNKRNETRREKQM